jgi:hypothetical protein
MFLNGNFVALDAFKKRYGVQVAGETGKTIETKWQSSLFQAGQCGAFVGVFMAVSEWPLICTRCTLTAHQGPITNRLGYRLTTLLALVLMNATIFISFFVSLLTSVVDSQANTVCRLIHWLSSSLVRHSRVSLGVCSSPTLLHTPRKSSLSYSVVPAQLLCKWPGPSAVSSSPALLTASTSAPISGPGVDLSPCSGSSL